MQSLPPCPVCTLENTYLDGGNYVCPDCEYEWPVTAARDGSDANEGGSAVVKDANGNPLADGDHEVACRMDAGRFMLNACFLKKAWGIGSLNNLKAGSESRCRT